MTDERKLTARLRDTGRCATCFEAFNPACPRAVLDEGTVEVPREAAEPVRPAPRPRATAGSEVGGVPGAVVAPRVGAQPPVAPRSRGTAAPAGSAETPSGSAPVRDPRRPRAGASGAPSPWQERAAPRPAPGAAAPAPGASARRSTTTPGASPGRAPRPGAAAPGRAEAPATEGGTSR